MQKPTKTDANVIAKLAMTGPQKLHARPIAISAEDLGAAFELIKTSSLSDYLVPNTAQRDRDSIEHLIGLINSSQDPAIKTAHVAMIHSLEERLRIMRPGESLLGQYADCPINNKIIESVARIKKYLAKNSVQKVTEEATSLVWAMLATKIPEYKLANHDVRLEAAPAQLTPEEVLHYGAARKAVSDFVAMQMQQSGSKAARKGV